MENQENKNISEQEAYQAMFLFLDFYWKLGNKKSDDLAVLLGGLALLPDGDSADPALMHDWKKCLSEVMEYRDKPENAPWQFKLRK
jgi:hypothetical protein